MAFSSGLSVPTMSTHHPAEQRERERQSEAKATQSYTLIAPCRMWEKAESGGGDVERPLVSATAWSASCHQEVRATRGVLWKGIVGRWSHKFKCGTQTGMNCLIQSLKAVHSLGSLSRAMMSAHWLTNSSSSSEFYSRTQLQRLHQLQVEKYSQITKWTKWERSTATGEWKRFLWTGAGAICVTLLNKLRCWQEQ